MIRAVTLASTLLVISLVTPAVYAGDHDDPHPGQDWAWKKLFDGTSMEGWEHIGPGSFNLSDGVLRSEGGMGLLWYTKEKFGDCRIRVVYRTSSRLSNSGVFVRIAEKPKDPWEAVHQGYEIQICDHQDSYHATGAIYSMSPARCRPSHSPGRWNTLEVTLKGPKIEVDLNGARVNNFDPARPVPPRTRSFEPERGPRPQSGYLGIQNHDDYAEDTHVEFKEISVQNLKRE